MLAAQNLLKQQLIAARAQLDRQAAQLHRLNRVSNRIIAGTDDRPIVEVFAEAIPDILDVAIGAAWLLPPVDDMLPPAFAAFGVDAERLGWASAGQALVGLAPPHVPKALDPPPAWLLPGPALENVFVCAVVTGGRPVAVLLAANTAAMHHTIAPFDAAEMLGVIAEMCSAHIDLRVDRQLIESQLASVRDSRLQLALVLSGTNDGWWDWDLKRDECYWSPRLLEMMSAEPHHEGLRRPFWGRHVHPDDQARFQAEVERALGADEAALSTEVRLRRDDGQLVPILVRGRALRDDAGEAVRLCGAAIDLSEPHRAREALAASERSLRQSLAEKEALLKEVHHRVKNNLQIINSFIRLELGRPANVAARAVLTDIKGRILSMAVLHEQLYRSGQFASVDLAAYLTQVAQQAMRTLMSDRPIALRCDLAPVFVTLDTAVPCGLIVNEWLSNIAKHAFPDGRSGQVRLALHCEGTPPTAVLRIADDGVGLPADWQTRRQASLGLQLVGDLTRQLQASLDVDGVSGVAFTIRFSAGISNERHFA